MREEVEIPANTDTAVAVVEPASYDGTSIRTLNGPEHTPVVEQTVNTHASEIKKVRKFL